MEAHGNTRIDMTCHSGSSILSGYVLFEPILKGKPCQKIPMIYFTFGFLWMTVSPLSGISNESHFTFIKSWSSYIFSQVGSFPVKSNHVKSNIHQVSPLLQILAELPSHTMTIYFNMSIRCFFCSSAAVSIFFWNDQPAKVIPPPSAHHVPRHFLARCSGSTCRRTIEPLNIEWMEFVIHIGCIIVLCTYIYTCVYITICIYIYVYTYIYNYI